jgi:hypothetical protein
MSALPRKRVFVLLGVLAVSASLLVWQQYFRRPLGIGIPTSGGTAMNTRIAAPLFKQWNPSWSKQTLGATDSPMGSTGCTVCSLAMALTSRGFQFDPPSLNRQLAKHQAFTHSGLLIWAGVSAVTKGDAKAHLDDRPTHGAIDAQLAAGNPVIAKVLYDNRIWHWVLITGKSATNYLIHDPLSSGPEYETMTAYPRGIYAIRYLERP